MKSTLIEKEKAIEVYNDGQARVLIGHVLDVLAELPAESVNVVVTSPPYWSQRRYAGEQSVIWGDGSKCALGLEKTIESYLTHLVEVMRAVKRVLRKDGVAWVDIGDKYAGSNSGKGDYRKNKGLQKDIYNWEGPAANITRWDKWRRDKGGEEHGVSLSDEPIPAGLKPGDLCLIPQRLAIALQADGWGVRSQVIWWKPSAMPESVHGWFWAKHRIKVKAGSTTKVGNTTDQGYRSWTVFSGQGTCRTRMNNTKWADCPGCPKCQDNNGLMLRKGSWRPTEDYEPVLMLTKSKSYFADGEGVKRKLDQASIARNQYQWNSKQRTHSPEETRGNDHREVGELFNPTGANLRTVWRIVSEGSRFQHFAAFPTELPRLCILASTSEKGYCDRCGEPWARVIKPSDEYAELLGKSWTEDTDINHDLRMEIGFAAHTKNVACSADYQTLGWRATCKCLDAGVKPAVVLDPFCGTGSTLLAAKQLGCKSIGIDISSEYCKMSAGRIKQLAMLE